MLKRSDEERRTEGVVDNQWDVVAMGHLGYGIDVEHVAVRIAESLSIDQLGIRLNSILQCLQVA